MNKQEAPIELTPKERELVAIINKSVIDKPGHEKLGKPRPPRKKSQISQNDE